MKRLILPFVALIFIARPLVADDSPAAAVRAFYRALYARDGVALDKVIVPDARSAKLVAGEKLDPARLQQLEEEIRELKLNPASEPLFRGRAAEPAADGSLPVGTVARYTATLGGNLAVITTVKQKDGWKVDLRWWLNAMEIDGPPPEGSPEYAIKRLLFATASYDRDEAKKWILPGSDVELLFLGAPPEPEPSDQLLALTMEMPLVEMHKGEFVRLPFDHVAEGTSEADRKIYQGLFGMVDLPFVVMKRDGAWRVIPQPYYAMMNQ